MGGGGGVAYDQPFNHFPSQTGGEKMRRTKSASATSKSYRKRDMLKSRSPPARQPSPLVTDTQQPVYQVIQQPRSPQEPASSKPVYHVLQQPSPQPVYQVLQQPGSPQEPAPPPSSEPVYHVLQQSGSPQHVVSSQAPPTYEVLQQPGSPMESAPYKPPPVYNVLQPDHSSFSPSAFQHEEFKLLSQSGNNASRARGKGALSRNAMNSSQPQLHNHRAVSTTTLHQKHRIIDTEVAVPPSPMSHQGFRSMTSELSNQRCETAPADYTTESLV